MENVATLRVDRIRARTLHFILKPSILRHVYGQAHLRLSLGVLLSTLVYLPLSILKPELLLLFGPMIMGYPHLVASYRYIAHKKFIFFILMTAVAIILHLSKVGFLQHEVLPFGVWQIVVATISLFVVRIMAREFKLLEMLYGLIVCITLISLAWKEPIIYVGGTLILHNWIAYIYWIFSCKESKRRTTAIVSTIFFLVIHYLVLAGRLDHWFPLQGDAPQFTGETHVTGWYLASWTSDPWVWYRFLVIYVFGLSMHYFVWLKAIPESLATVQHPLSFRATIKNIRQELGNKTWIMTSLAIIAGLAMWCWAFKLGSSIYFELAILHGALEVLFLFPKLKMWPTHR
ncbi:MAG: hypothetical protein H0V66_06785 [Bdellovibrionales bacterium]|nr:hypothetical protein [Bdellovibrionales bacterium]